MTAVPDARTRHVLSRFAVAPTTALQADVAAAGGIDDWFALQLTPAQIPDDAADATFDWWPSLALSQVQLWQKYVNGETAFQLMLDFQNWTMMRRLLTRRCLLEAMTDFWANLFHVPPESDPAWVFRTDYELMLRTNALTTFENLLSSAVAHPCMGLYLDNVESTGTAINENLGRELLECHTVGVGADYTQPMVVDSARILTGFHVDQRKTWAASYDPSDHWTGAVRVMDFHAANTKADGRGVLADYLHYLATHQDTATRICQRLAVRFVGDSPSDDLVNDLASTYLANGTSIVPVLKALFASDEFNDPSGFGGKLRTPVEDALATWAMLGVSVDPPQTDDSAANEIVQVSRAIGQTVYDWPAPNGFPDVAPAWDGAGRILGSFHEHWMAAGGYWPNEGITFVPPADWVPTLPAQFSDVVDHVARTLLQVPATHTMQLAAQKATGLTAQSMVESDGLLMKFRFGWLLVSLLDTPAHLSR
jgi:uncharacterized protein (DUF1800 family)